MTGIRVRGEDGWLQGDDTQAHAVVTQKLARREEDAHPDQSTVKPLCTCGGGETNDGPAANDTTLCHNVLGGQAPLASFFHR